RQLATLLADQGGTSTIVDIRPFATVLHLKSAIAWLGHRRLIVAAPLVGQPAFHEFEIVPVTESESLGANSLLVHEQVLVAAGCDELEARIRALGLEVTVLEMSEFQKMDGGLSCLSLRVPSRD